MEQYAAPQPSVVWPLRVGTVPQLASAFQPRTGLRERIDQARAGHTAVVLTQGIAGGGGAGKSQLAAAYAHQALAAGIELVVWANAAETEQIITGYAVVAHRVQAPGADGQDAETDARAFLDWLAVTPRSWLVVLDDLTDLEAIGPWWPPPSAADNGWVLATTRRRDALLSGGGRTVIEVDAYAPTEALSYLRDRFTGARMAHLMDQRADEVVRQLGRLPLALAQAAAYMINEDVPCARYLQLFTDRQYCLDDLLPDTEYYGRQISAALLLTLDAAQRCDPVGLAVPAIRLAAYLDPVGHPESLWTGAAVTAYLTHHHAVTVSADQARAVLRLLHRYGLVTCDSRDGPRSVRLHALTARATREAAPISENPATVQAAAEALAEMWPDSDHADPDLCTVLRANTDTLAAHAGDLLDCHPVLYRTGASLMETGLYAAAVIYWHGLAADAERLLGDDHPDTLTARSRLASSYQGAGRTGEAITLGERVVADAERLLGYDHPDTVAARGSLAYFYQRAGRIGESITLLEQNVADRERLLGDEHPETVAARGSLAFSYQRAGRTGEAITLGERVVVDAERLLGNDHRGTLGARVSLATTYQAVGRTGQAITLLEQTVTDTERLLGDEHRDTLTARANLAFSYQRAGRFEEAITLLERVVASAERFLGDEHPDTLTARGSLATSYQGAGRIGEAITLGERVVADAERLLGNEHPDTLTTRSNLAVAYQHAGRTGEAITLGERVVADAERLLGNEHPENLAYRGGLAFSYQQAGRTGEAINLLEQTVTDTRRVLGDEHPGTLVGRYSLALSYRQAGRFEEAITLLEQVVADAERLLGNDHPDTLAVAEALHDWRRSHER
ncbi:tetratricopeptide repeat protein [Streptomyces sp. NPDC059017]|uniref:tetratricopeptide repeat protein n=1 Tax=unclassified Streptomyces TaxID=2593676 RepID=UPI0034191389